MCLPTYRSANAGAIHYTNEEGVSVPATEARVGRKGPLRTGYHQHTTGGHSVKGTHSTQRTHARTHARTQRTHAQAHVRICALCLPIYLPTRHLDLVAGAAAQIDARVAKMRESSAHLSQGAVQEEEQAMRQTAHENAVARGL